MNHKETSCKLSIPGSLSFDGFKEITESRQFISRPQAIRGCDYSHWGLYIEMFCPVALCEWEGSCPVKSHHSRTVRFLTLTPYMLSDATMDSCFRALCMTFVLASFTRRSGAVGPVIKCEPCDVGARLLCKPLPKDCAEKVREPGCGCCMTCALSFGQPCGVYTGRCGSGLTCQHQPGETKPLQALLEGRGICANATNKRLTARPTPPVNELPGNSCACTVSLCALHISLLRFKSILNVHASCNMCSRLLFMTLAESTSF